MIKLAFGSVPKDGGTFTFYRNMRPALRKHWIDMRCVAIGREQADLWEAPYVDEGCVLLAPKTRSIKKQAQAFADWCEAERIDLVMGINSEAILSALPHLPQRIRCMSRCANSFDHGYRITLSGYERLAAIIAQTPRQLKDLTETYGADAGKITVIPNGVEPSLFGERLAVSGEQLTVSSEQLTVSGERIRLGFLGRLEHKQKGVLFLPGVVRELDRLGVAYHLRIAGKGRHEEKLKAEMRKVEKGKQGQIEFLGPVTADEVPHFLKQTDIFLFPSQFEGCPNALLEAMMAGCAPVAWRLEGITDFIIEDGVSGAIVPLGDCRAFAEAVAALAHDPARLQATRAAAAERARSAFATGIAAERYAQLIHAVMQQPPPAWTPLPWSQFQPDPNFKHSWRDWIPKGIKKGLRKVMTS